jgi:hypothetical protein
VILAGTAPRLDPATVGAAFTRLAGAHTADIARRFLAGDVSLGDEYDAYCLPLYATAPLDPDLFSRSLANEALSVHFKREWNAMDLRPGLSGVHCQCLSSVPNSIRSVRRPPWQNWFKHCPCKYTFAASRR